MTQQHTAKTLAQALQDGDCSLAKVMQPAAALIRSQAAEIELMKADGAEQMRDRCAEVVESNANSCAPESLLWLALKSNAEAIRNLK